MERFEVSALIREVLLDMELRTGEFADDSLTAAERRDLATDIIVEGMFD